MDTNLTDEQISVAVSKRVLEGKTWKQIAEDLHTTRKTLYAARKTDRWAEVAQGVICELKAEALPIAWRGLLEAAERRDVAACREILNRLESVVTQKHEVTTDSTGDAAAKLEKKLADLHKRRLFLHTVEGRKLSGDFAKGLAELYEKEARGELTIAPEETPEEKEVKRALAAVEEEIEAVTGDVEAAVILKELVELAKGHEEDGEGDS